MKKLFYSAAVIAAMFAFVACSSPADKAKAYAEEIAAAVAEGDLAKAQEISEEAEKWYDSLSEEDKKVADEASEAVTKAAAEAAEEALESFGL